MVFSKRFLIRFLISFVTKSFFKSSYSSHFFFPNEADFKTPRIGFNFFEARLPSFEEKIFVSYCERTYSLEFGPKSVLLDVHNIWSKKEVKYIELFPAV